MDWDLIPNIAIDKVNLEGSNPVFGLNALGGAVNIQLKNGFTWQGFEADISGGSFGQVQGEFQYGKQAGNTSTYVAGTVLHQNGWRDLQSTDLQNIYGDVGWRSDRAELHLNITAAHSVLNGPGTSPVELLAADPERAVHCAQSDQQPIWRGQPDWHRGRDRHHLDPGARVLSLFPAAGDQRQRTERYAVQ